jgi:hypothetical protein
LAGWFFVGGLVGLFLVGGFVGSSGRLVLFVCLVGRLVGCLPSIFPSPLL